MVVSPADCPKTFPPRTLRSVTEPVSRFFESSRLRLHYAVWGDEGNPPLVLVHGGRDHCRSWDFVAQALTDRYCVYAPDLRGHGDSAWAVGSEYRLVDHVSDIQKLLAVIDRGAVPIVGHSLGGRVVLDYAGAFPESVTRVVSIEGFSLGWRTGRGEKAPERLRRFVQEVRDIEKRTPRVYPTIDAAEERMKEANRRLSPKMARHLTEHALRRVEGGYVWKFDNYVRLWPPPEWTMEQTKEIWQRIKSPLLLIAGNEGMPMPAVGDVTKMLPKARLVTFEGAGHWVHHDRFDDFVALLRDFLS
jgi:pimeloyl-ACP methyl ester carboxylesterase